MAFFKANILDKSNSFSMGLTSKRKRRKSLLSLCGMMVSSPLVGMSACLCGIINNTRSGVAERFHLKRELISHKSASTFLLFSEPGPSSGFSSLVSHVDTPPRASWYECCYRACECFTPNWADLYT